MTLIIGLGNPGEKYAKTRHSLGFRIVDKFRMRKKFSSFKFSKKINSLISRGKFNKKKIILVKPQTFMNKSGKAVKFLIKNLKLKTRNLFVVHDDIDLPLGETKISIGRGSAGHKGVQSIIDELGSKNFVRFRIGIKPKPYTLTPKTLESFVLKKFNKKEERILRKVIKKTVEAIEVALKEGVGKAMNEFNKPRLTG
ncbi:aminoacyl-tRNA hydrolase [Patescibacteria group bacterium]|nr:aminoacyl-tRNA hydrolase [Patescibacteria group bacterium]